MAEWIATNSLINSISFSNRSSDLVEISVSSEKSIRVLVADSKLLNESTLRFDGANDMNQSIFMCKYHAAVTEYAEVRSLSEADVKASRFWKVLS